MAAVTRHGGSTFGAPKNLLLSSMVFTLIILLNRQRNPYLRVASLVIAMAAGYALAWFMGMYPESNEPMTQELIMKYNALSITVLALNEVVCR